MKRFALLAVAVLAVACAIRGTKGEQEQTGPDWHELIKAEVLRGAVDPETFSWISLEAIDTITWQQIFDDRVNVFKSIYEGWDKKALADHLAGMEEIRTVLGDTITSPAAIIFEAKYRVSAEFFGLSPWDVFFRMTPQGETIDVTLNKDDACDIDRPLIDMLPGYLNMLERIEAKK